MKVQILRNTAAGGYHVCKGDCPDLSDRDALILIRMAKAKLYEPSFSKPKPSKKKKYQTDDQVEVTNEQG